MLSSRTLALPPYSTPIFIDYSWDRNCPSMTYMLPPLSIGWDACTFFIVVKCPPPFASSLHAFFFGCGFNYLYPIDVNAFTLGNETTHNPCRYLIVCDTTCPKHRPIYLLYSYPIFRFQLEFPWTPKHSNAFFHGDVFTIQVLGIFTNTIQLSNGGKENNILLYDVHQWPIF